MANTAAWFMFFFGIGHIVFGLVQYKGPVTDAVAARNVGPFAKPELRRTAFWAALFGCARVDRGWRRLIAIRNMTLS